MNNVSPTIMQLDLVGGMGMFSNNQVADAADHFDRMADTFTTDVTYCGIDLCVEVNRHSRNAVDIVAVADGSDMYYEFSDMARQNIARLAIAKAEL